MINRSPISTYNGDPHDGFGAFTYYVKTDEQYEVQYGDRTVEVIGEADLLFENVQIPGYSFWVIRHTNSGQYLKGYLFKNGHWVEVEGA